VSPPPSFLRLAGHPVRWRLLNELAHSDRRVRELSALVGRRQSLVSYHLRCLRTERLVTMRRSSADGRDAYYRLDLSRCGELLNAVGTELHPGLGSATGGGGRTRGPRPRVLFLCTGNSARSQMAEAFAADLGAVDAYSAGSHPKPIHPEAVRVMRERGIDLSGRRSKHLSEFVGQPFDYIISLCDRLREVCPEFPGHPDLIHWSIADPSRDGDFARAAAELAARIPFLIARIENNDKEVS
jgi:protein-tyrosine-phosphatase/DNA-binding transcriptional ArsR family regulator